MKTVRIHDEQADVIDSILGTLSREDKVRILLSYGIPAFLEARPEWNQIFERAIETNNLEESHEGEKNER
jgi:hypothetical protein